MDGAPGSGGQFFYDVEATCPGKRVISTKPTLATVRLSRRWGTRFVEGSSLKGYLDYSLFAVQVGSVAGMGPVFGFEYEAAGYRVSVQIADLLCSFGLGEDVEVVVTDVPEGALRGLLADGELEEVHCFRELGQSGCRGGGGWLGQEQMDVLGHDDVGEDVEVKLLTGSFEGVLEEVSGFRGAEIGSAVVTTDRDEMVVVFGLESFETVRHGWSVGRSCLDVNSTKVGAPSSPRFYRG